MNVPLWLHLQTTITEDLVWALHLVSLCRHGSLCFAQPFKMHEMSKSIERTVINRHAFLFIFCFKRRFCAEDAGRTRGTRVQTCRLQYNRLLPTPNSCTNIVDCHQSSQCSGLQCCVLRKTILHLIWETEHYTHLIQQKIWGGCYFTVKRHTHQLRCWWVEFILIQILRHNMKVRLCWLPGH